jgi:hypothetical protein
MLRGFLDAVTSSDHVLGWAYDTDQPLQPLRVCIVTDDGMEVAQGLAHEYREDLTRAGCAGGWCGFRLRATVSDSLPWQGLSLIDAHSRQSILRRARLPYITSEETPIRSIDELVVSDPTIIGSLDQLSGLNEVFASFCDRFGAEAYVRAAYIYLLGRSADASGLKAYRRHLQAGNSTPYELLRAIADSEEYRSRPRRHCAPTAAGFPFKVG